MNASAKIHVTPAVVKGKYSVRWVSNQENFSDKHVEEAWKMIQDFATTLFEKKLVLGAAHTPFNQDRFSLTRKVSKEVYDRQPNMLVELSFHEDYILLNFVFCF